jgi:hypothetical protein
MLKAKANWHDVFLCTWLKPRCKTFKFKQFANTFSIKILMRLPSTADGPRGGIFYKKRKEI